MPASDRVKRILVVDDEQDIAELLDFNLKKQGFTTTVARNGREAIAEIKRQTPDLVILDVMMPELSGIEVLGRLRSQPETASLPVIMLTAKGEEIDELVGLSLGADDYIPKPFSMKILIARVEAILRRSSVASIPAADRNPADFVELGPLRLDLSTHEATVDATPIHLTLTEFRVLSSLLEASGRVLSRAALISKAIGPGITVTERTIDVHVTAIRKKLGPQSGMIHTVRGVGYRISLQPE